MKTTHAYLIAEKLYFNSASNPLCNRSWLFSIYKSLLISNANDKEEIKWTKYNQWNIDHNCRAAKASARKNGVYISTFTLTVINDTEAELKVTFSKKDLKTESISGVYERNTFINSLWEYKNPKGEAILQGVYERDQLFDSSIYSFDEIEEEIETNSPTKLDTKEKKRTRKAADDHIREMKFNALKNLLDQIREHYHQTTELNQRSFLEIVVGAAIFYLPSLNSHFNGFISIGALKGYLKGDRRVKDHLALKIAHLLTIMNHMRTMMRL